MTLALMLAPKIYSKTEHNSWMIDRIFYNIFSVLLFFCCESLHLKYIRCLMEEQLYRQKYDRTGERVVMCSVRCGACSQHEEQLGDTTWWRREEGTKGEMKQESLQKPNINWRHHLQWLQSKSMRLCRCHHLSHTSKDLNSQGATSCKTCTS